jgi:hypothetical protein
LKDAGMDGLWKGRTKIWINLRMNGMNGLMEDRMYETDGLYGKDMWKHGKNYECMVGRNRWMD